MILDLFILLLANRLLINLVLVLLLHLSRPLNNQALRLKLVLLILLLHLYRPVVGLVILVHRLKRVQDL